MSWREWFVIYRSTSDNVPNTIEAAPDSAPSAGGASPSASDAQGVFISKQSLMSFPGASLAVMLLWKTTEVLVPDLAGSLYVPFVFSLLIGYGLWWITVKDPAVTMNDFEKRIAAGIGALNSLYLFVSVTGIDVMVKSTTSAAGA